MTARGRTRPAPPREELPAVLDSPRAKLVYLYLSAVEPATVDRLSTALDMDKLSLLPVLSTLTRRGLVERSEEGYVDRYERE